jgi:flagellar M-ring protein FliF
VLAAIAKTRAWFRALPRLARILLVTSAAAAIVGGGGLALLKANEPYATLFAQLDRDDASTIIAKLKEMKVPYRVEADGTSVEVPESRARELRLELAGAGLPRGGGVGFESFDKMRLGATDFEQRVLYRRALEGELSRTIGTITAVESSRVHLVLPEKSVFVTKNEPASASIVLRLRPGRTLSPSEVAGIVHLSASAVPSLEVDRIAVVTTEGLMLHRPRRSGAGGDDPGDAEDEGRAAARSYETSVEDRVRAMLERVVGAGHADVRVTADLDPARVEHLEEHFDPTRTVLRSEERSVERQSGDLDDVAGVPGAESNLPPVPGAKDAAKPAASASAAAAAAPAVPVRESHTRNYEVDRVTDKRTLAAGALRRLTVAVVLDGVKGEHGVTDRPRAELDRLAALVKSASGATDGRGDVVTVESMPFVIGDAPDVPVPVAPAAPTRTDLLRKWAPIPAGGVILLGIVIAMTLRRRRAKRTSTPLVLSATPTTAQLEAAVTPVLASDELRAKAHARALQDPATAALVLRSWLGTALPDAHDGAKP